MFRTPIRTKDPKVRELLEDENIIPFQEESNEL